jgi:tRNA nucleotidyltransferase/poly(A) polymerase
VATDAKPDRIHDLFPEMTSFNLKHGTVTLVSKGRNFEVTTFRGAGYKNKSIVIAKRNRPNRLLTLWIN